MSELYCFDPGRIEALAQAGVAAYADADPFPHAVFDDFLPKDVVERAAAAFPGLDAVPWHRTTVEPELKLSLNDENAIPDPLRLLIWVLSSSLFLRFLELTGIEGLVSIRISPAADCTGSSAAAGSRSTATSTGTRSWVWSAGSTCCSI